MADKTPQVGENAIMYGVPCKVTEVTEVERFRRVKRRREAYQQVLVHLDPGLPEPLALEVEQFYRLKTGEWTTKGRLLSRDERRRYRELRKDRIQHPQKIKGGEEAAREFLRGG